MIGHNFQGYEETGNEKLINVVRHVLEDIVWSSKESLEKFIRELREVATHVNTSPNSLGRMDKHKITFSHRQMDPSMIGKIDLLESTKDVGQSFLISPWGNLDGMMIGQTSSKSVDKDKQKNIKYELFDFIRTEFPNPMVTFNANTPEEYDMVLDKLCMTSQINLDYRIKPPIV